MKYGVETGEQADRAAARTARPVWRADLAGPLVEEHSSACAELPALHLLPAPALPTIAHHLSLSSRRCWLLPSPHSLLTDPLSLLPSCHALLPRHTGNVGFPIPPSLIPPWLPAVVTTDGFSVTGYKIVRRGSNPLSSRLRSVRGPPGALCWVVLLLKRLALLRVRWPNPWHDGSSPSTLFRRGATSRCWCSMAN